MIYCFTIMLAHPVVTDDAGLLDEIHEFGWGYCADDAGEATLDVLRAFGIQVKSIANRAIAGDQDFRRYPIPEMIHGLPWDLLQEASSASLERKLN